MAEGEELGSNLLRVLHRRPAELGGLGKVARAAPALPAGPKAAKRAFCPEAALAAEIRAGCRATTSKLRPLPPSADRGPLPQLKGGDPEYPLQTQPRDRAGIHARGLEHWREPQVLRQGDRVTVDARNVEEDLAAATAGQQSRQNHLGGGAIVGHQRADLAALPAWTDHAPAGKPAIAHERATDMTGRADPGAQERGARSRKHRRVVRLHSHQWDVGQRDDPSLRRIPGRDGAAVTDVGISELEPGLSVVLLLRHHAIEPDHA